MTGKSEKNMLTEKRDMWKNRQKKEKQTDEKARHRGSRTSSGWEAQGKRCTWKIL